MRKLVVLLTVLSGAIVGAQPSAQPSRFTLTVDSIMRGPALVGYPPTDLRWSGDSKELYFEWRCRRTTKRRRGWSAATAGSRGG